MIFLLFKIDLNDGMAYELEFTGNRFPGTLPNCLQENSLFEYYLGCSILLHEN